MTDSVGQRRTWQAPKLEVLEAANAETGDSRCKLWIARPVNSALDSIHLRHAGIHKYHVVILLLDRRNGFEAIFCHGNDMTRGRQNGGVAPSIEGSG